MATEKRSSRPTSHEEVIGKIVLVGVSYYDDHDDLLHMDQVYGEIAAAGEDRIVVKVSSGGRELVLPADLSLYRFAEKGDYRILATGEVVTNPDLITTVSVAGSPPQPQPPAEAAGGRRGKRS